ncbi:hypothetical protein ACJJTC_005412 [Scirpophaga incertulas]
MSSWLCDICDIIYSIYIIVWRTEGGEAEEQMVSLEPYSGVGAAHCAAFVNQLRLSELRAALARAGLPAEFSGGALECAHGTLAVRRVSVLAAAALARAGLPAEFSGGALECAHGTLAVRRLDNGRVALEGVLSEDYYKVRELLYEQFAIV